MASERTNGKARAASTGVPGDLIVIGGAEEHSPRGEILKEVGRRAEGKTLVILPLATREPRDVADEYRRIFEDLKVDKVEVVDVRSSSEAKDEEMVDRVRDAAVLFFPGGDQKRLADVLKRTPLLEAILEAHKNGAHVAGTSAGAAAMPATMVARGTDEDSPEPETVEIDHGLGLLPDAIVDTHFGQRGRFGRILSAVGHHPDLVGLGIDEDTALIIKPDGVCEVVGNNAVYVVDGSQMTYSSVQEERDHEDDDTMSLFDVRLHVLARGDKMDWKSRTPTHAEGTKVA
jgi:cyanophycinase